MGRKSPSPRILVSVKKSIKTVYNKIHGTSTRVIDYVKTFRWVNRLIIIHEKRKLIHYGKIQLKKIPNEKRDRIREILMWVFLLAQGVLVAVYTYAAACEPGKIFTTVFGIILIIDLLAGFAVSKDSLERDS